MNVMFQHYHVYHQQMKLLYFELFQLMESVKKSLNYYNIGF
jgi:hypothetical protein